MVSTFQLTHMQLVLTLVCQTVNTISHVMPHHTHITLHTCHATPHTHHTAHMSCQNHTHITLHTMSCQNHTHITLHTCHATPHTHHTATPHLTLHCTRFTHHTSYHTALLSCYLHNQNLTTLLQDVSNSLGTVLDTVLCQDHSMLTTL